MAMARTGNHVLDGEKMMKIKIKVLLAIVVIVGAAYWAFTTVTTYNYSGSSIMFPIGSGHVVVTNTGDEAIPIEVRTEGRAATFRIASAELGLAESAKREGSGRDAYYTLSFELPPGQARVDVTRGSDLNMISRSDTRIEAVVAPMAPTSVRWIRIASVVAIALALYYISRVTNHAWIGWLRGKISRKEELQSNQTTA
jgi:hypothetical protein